MSTTNNSEPLINAGIPLAARSRIIPYEQRLQQEKGWALDEGQKHFSGGGLVHNSLQRIAKRLNELEIPYAVAGGMALFYHGYQRFTSDVDILVTREGLKAIHANLDGLGYVPPFSQSKNLRDTESGVKIEFLITGDYPGDGKPKAISFPDPATVNEVAEGISFIGLPTLVELKLASGMTNTQRGKDLIDVQELIQSAKLPLDFQQRLHPFVQQKFDELWHVVNATSTRYVLLWRNKWLTADAQSLADMAAKMTDAAHSLQAMLADGVELDVGGSTSDDYALLFTNDEQVAAKYGMVPEGEFWDEDAERAED